MNNFLIERNIEDTTYELKDKLARLTILCEVTRAINSLTNRDELLKLILNKTKEILGVIGASLIFYDEKEKMLYFPIVVGENPKVENRLKQLRFSMNEGIAGWVFREGKPSIVQDVNSDRRFYQKIDESTDCRTKSILCVPLRGTKGIFGVLEAINKKNGEFTDNDQQLLMSMADNIAITIEKANLYHELQKTEALLRRQNAELKRSVKQKYSFENIVHCSDEFRDLLKKTEQVSLTDSTVLVYGETGTGKELIAHAIHNYSPRASKNFVAINCGAIPENLLESELFGHEKGAFTNAIERRIGRFEEADQGTIFLDEIGDMPFNLQVKLLRVLQEGAIQRLGANHNTQIDVRLVAATHQNLVKLVTNGKFRQDLYYRLKVFELNILPLRERRDDIKPLINHFIKTHNKKLGKQIEGCEPSVFNILHKYDYPGNVRELEHIIERAMIFCDKKLIGIDNLSEEMRNRVPSTQISLESGKFFAIPRDNDELKAIKAEARKKAEEKVELMFLNDLLPRTQGNVSEAARKVKMNRSQLAQLVCKYKLDIDKFRI